MHPVHSPCAGAETKRTVLYTPDMADAIHSAIQEESLSQRATAAMASVPKVRGECDDAENEMIGRLDPTEHREKLGPERLWCTIITKTLATVEALQTRLSATRGSENAHCARNDKLHAL